MNNMYNLNKPKILYPINIPINRPYHTINTQKKMIPVPPVKVETQVAIWSSPKKSYPENVTSHLGSKKTFNCKKTYWGSKKYQNKKTYWGSKRKIYKPHYGSKKVGYYKKPYQKFKMGGSKYANKYKSASPKKKIGYKRNNKYKSKTVNNFVPDRQLKKDTSDEKNTFVSELITKARCAKKN